VINNKNRTRVSKTPAPSNVAWFRFNEQTAIAPAVSTISMGNWGLRGRF